jgi:hypothetical protein
MDSMGTRSTRFAASETGRSTVLAASIAAPSLGSASPSVADSRLRVAPNIRVAHWWPDAFAVVTILALTGLISWQRLWLQNGLAHLDISTFYLPWYAYLGEHLRHFDIPGWNPSLFSGTAFAGDPQSGWMYLPAMVLFTFIDAVHAYEIFLIFHLALAGLGAYAYGRVLGLRTIASLTAAVAFEFGPFVNHISCCVIHVQLAAWIPVALLGVELTMRATTRTGRAASWVLTGFCISQMLAGWIGQGAYNGLLVVGGYIAFRALVTAVPGVATVRQRIARMLVDGAGTTLIGAGLGAAGWIPRFAVVGHTNLAGGHYSGHEIDAYSSGWTLMQLLDRLLTDDNGFLSLTFYLGAPTVALMAIAPYLARARLRTPFFVAVTLFSSVMTLQQTGFQSLVYALFPRFEMLQSHVPSRILAIQWIGPAMLAGITVELLFQEASQERIRRAAIVGSSLWGVAIVALIGFHAGISIWTILFAIATCATVAAFARPGIWTGRPHGRATTAQLGLGLLFVLLVLVDPAGRGFADTLFTGRQSALLALPTGPVARDAASVNASTTDPDGAGGYFQQLQDEGQVFRYFGYDYALNEAGYGYPSTYREYYWLPEAQELLVNARGMMLGLDDVQGYDPMQLSNYINAIVFANHEQQNYHDSQIMPSGLDSPILDILGVRYIVVPNDRSPGRPSADTMQLLETHPEVFRNDSVRVLENPNALPRAWTVHEAHATSNDFALVTIDSGLVDPAQVAFLDPNVAVPLLAALPTGAADQVSITANSGDEVHLRATMAAAGLVVVGDTYDSDWTAYVDGHKVKLYQADGVIQAVPVPAGSHEVKLVYAPRSLRIGLIVSWTALGATLAILAAYVWTRRGRRSAPNVRPIADPA